MFQNKPLEGANSVLMFQDACWAASLRPYKAHSVCTNPAIKRSICKHKLAACLSIEW